MRLLTIYNTCGIKNEPVDWYIQCLEALLDQKHDSFEHEIIVSSCLNNSYTRDRLRTHFGNKLSYNWIDDRLTVNQTFNHSVRMMIKHRGQYDIYNYIDSGMHFQNQTSVIQQAIDLWDTGHFGMLTIQASNDTGFPEWLGKHGHFAQGQDFVMPVGRACNLHAQFFAHSLYEAYGNIIPDIFVAYCTESVFSMMCAALRLQWIIMGGPVILHNKSIDGATIGFDHQGNKGCSWNNLWGNKDVKDIINHPNRPPAFFYEEMQGVCMHDPSQYDEYGLCKDAGLKDFIKDQLFLKKEELDYDNINYKLEL